MQDTDVIASRQGFNTVELLETILLDLPISDLPSISESARHELIGQATPCVTSQDVQACGSRSPDFEQGLLGDLVLNLKKHPDWRFHDLSRDNGPLWDVHVPVRRATCILSRW